jgi:hypothetical protein
MTREQWLLAAIDELRPDFEAAGSPIPDKVRVSVGWPKGSRTAIGQCVLPEAVDDKTPAVFVSPVLSEPGAVLKTLIHELVHATGIRGHKASDFGRLGLKVGLVAPWKSSTLSDGGWGRVNALALKLGPFDHSAITIGSGTGEVKQSTRMLKAACSDDGYTVRLTKKWIESMGFPTCPCGEELVPA